MDVKIKCIYKDKGLEASQIILNSFLLFLIKELKGDAK